MMQTKYQPLKILEKMDEIELFCHLQLTSLNTAGWIQTLGLIWSHMVGPCLC